jgi:hypothetical protein
LGTCRWSADGKAVASARVSHCSGSADGGLLLAGRLYCQRIWPRHRRRGYGSPALLGGAVGNDAARRRGVHGAGSRDGNHGADNATHADTAADRNTTVNGYAAANSHTATDGNSSVDRDTSIHGDPKYNAGIHRIPRQD